jgi:Protein of unknown function (DUF2505)
VTTPFHFEHEFRAASPAHVLRAYFDPALAAEHDRISGIARREEIERQDEPARLTIVSRVHPERQLPVFVRPFVSGPLTYEERLVWDRAADRIELEIRPSVLNKRTLIRITYALSQPRAGVVRRIYEGDVTCEIAVVGRRVERMIVDDIGSVLATVVGCTQEWLDSHPA